MRWVSAGQAFSVFGFPCCPYVDSWPCDFPLDFFVFEIDGHHHLVAKGDPWSSDDNVALCTQLLFAFGDKGVEVSYPITL